MIYFDTSYIVRCYLEDPGFVEVRKLASTDDVACAAFGQTEATAAFHRKLREATLTQAQFAAVLSQFETDLAGNVFEWLPVTPSILNRARLMYRTLPPSVFLRSGDALHLACAQENGFKEVFSNDRHLLLAAGFCGMTGMNIISVPAS